MLGSAARAAKSVNPTKVLAPVQALSKASLEAVPSPTRRAARRIASEYIKKPVETHVTGPARQFRSDFVSRTRSSFKKGVDAHLADPTLNPVDAELAGLSKAVIDTAVGNARFYAKAQFKHAKAIAIGGTAIGIALAIAEDLGLEDVDKYRDPDRVVDAVIGERARTVVGHATSIISKGRLKSEDKRLDPSDAEEVTTEVIDSKRLEELDGKICAISSRVVPMGMVSEDLVEEVEKTKGVVARTLRSAPEKANLKPIALALFGPVVDKLASNVKRYTLDNEAFKATYRAGVALGDGTYRVVKKAAEAGMEPIGESSSEDRFSEDSGFHVDDMTGFMAEKIAEALVEREVRWSTSSDEVKTIPGKKKDKGAGQERS